MLLFSFSIICGHRSAKLIGGTEANFWRLTLAFLFLGIWGFGFGIGLGGVAFPLFLLSGIIGIGIGDVALFQALPRLGPQLSMLLIQCLTPPCGALIDWLWLGTTLSLAQLLCIMLILAGISVALAPGEHLHRSRVDLVTGTFFSILAAVGGAGGAVMSRRAFAMSHAAQEVIDGANAAFQRVAGGLLVGAICLLVVKRGVWFSRGKGDESRFIEVASSKWRRLWPWVLFNSLAGQTLGVSCMLRALETTPTGIVLAIVALTPIFVVPLAWLFEGEKPSLRSLIGGIVGVGGVVMLILTRR
jgi:drug/metabolite transporter (DMT)-like permease